VLTGPFEYEFALACRFFKEIRAAILETTGHDLPELVACRLAQLSPIEYDRVRQAEADAMGVPVTTLDAEVARARAALNPGDDAALQRQAAAVDEPGPWPRPPISG
jgi:putative DNA primase/helicase